MRYRSGGRDRWGVRRTVGKRWMARDHGARRRSARTSPCPAVRWAGRGASARSVRPRLLHGPHSRTAQPAGQCPVLIRHHPAPLRAWTKTVCLPTTARQPLAGSPGGCPPGIWRRWWQEVSQKVFRAHLDVRRPPGTRWELPWASDRMVSGANTGLAGGASAAQGAAASAAVPGLETISPATRPSAPRSARSRGSDEGQAGRQRTRSQSALAARHARRTHLSRSPTIPAASWPPRRGWPWCRGGRTCALTSRVDRNEQTGRAR